MLNDINVNNVAYSWNDIEIHLGIIDPAVHAGSLIGASLIGNPLVGAAVGAAYSNSNFAKPLIGVSSVNYNTAHDNQLVYSRQGFPVGRQYGKYECYGDITLDYYEMLELRKIKYSLPISLPFDVKIIYRKDGENDFIDTLYGCRISFPDSLGSDQGEMNLTATLQLNPVWINYGGKI